MADLDIQAGETIRLRDTSTGAVSRTWAYPGGTSTAAEVTFTPTVTSGQVTLQVQSSTGHTDTESMTYSTVSTAPPPPPTVYTGAFSIGQNTEHNTQADNTYTTAGLILDTRLSPSDPLADYSNGGWITISSQRGFVKCGVSTIVSTNASGSQRTPTGTPIVRLKMWMWNAADVAAGTNVAEIWSTSELSGNDGTAINWTNRSAGTAWSTPGGALGTQVGTLDCSINGIVTSSWFPATALDAGVIIKRPDGATWGVNIWQDESATSSNYSLAVEVEYPYTVQTTTQAPSPPPPSPTPPPPPAPTPPPSGFLGIPTAGKMYIGGNAGFRDYYPCPFTDIVRASRWFGHQGTWSNDPDLPVDIDGWPTGQCANTLAARTHLNTEPTGVYKGFYKPNGQPTTMTAVGLVNVTVSTPVLNAATGDYEFDFTVTGPYQGTLMFSAGVRELRVITPGYPTTGYPLLRAEYEAHYKKFVDIRILDILDCNDTEYTTGYDADWAHRRPPAHPRSFESACAFLTAIATAPNSKMRGANITNNAQFSQSDRILVAQKFRDLTPSWLTLAPEDSNERWNGGYGEKWAAQMAVVNDTNHPDYAWLAQQGGDQWDRLARYWCLQAARTAIAWETAFGAGSIGQRLRPVISSQFANGGWIGRMDTFMRSSQFINTFRPAGQLFYELNSAPYLGGSLAQMDAATTTTAMLAGLRTTFSGSLAAQTAGNADTLSYAAWEGYRASLGIATLGCYEGQFHLHGTNNVAIKLATKKDPNARILLEDYFQTMADAGFKVFRWLWIAPVPYANNDVNTGWAALESATDNSPSMQAMANKAAEWNT